MVGSETKLDVSGVTSYQVRKRQQSSAVDLVNVLIYYMVLGFLLFHFILFNNVIRYGSSAKYRGFEYSQFLTLFKKFMLDMEFAK